MLVVGRLIGRISQDGGLGDGFDRRIGRRRRQQVVQRPPGAVVGRRFDADEDAHQVVQFQVAERCHGEAAPERRTLSDEGGVHLVVEVVPAVVALQRVLVAGVGPPADRQVQQQRRDAFQRGVVVAPRQLPLVEDAQVGVAALERLADPVLFL